MSRTWIKLYTEILGDVKVGTLTDRQFRTLITCFLMSGQKDDKGFIGTTEQITWAMPHRQTKYVLSDLIALSKVKIVSKTARGWLLINFEKRQARPPSKQAAAEAMRKRNVRRMSAADKVRTRRMSAVRPHAVRKVSAPQKQKQKQKDQEHPLTTFGEGPAALPGPEGCG